MPKFSAALMVSIAIVASAGAAQAQLFGPRPEPRTVGPNAMPENMDPAMCDQLASMPNAPMSAEACRSMMGMAQGMKTAGSDPSAMRAGDENMSCEQINAEMQVIDHTHGVGRNGCAGQDRRRRGDGPDAKAAGRGNRLHRRADGDGCRGPLRSAWFRAVVLRQWRRNRP